MPGHGSPPERWARITAASARPVRGGGTVLAEFSGVLAEFSGHHVGMAGPEGNESCVAAKTR